jgi:hypothetical protein
MMSLSLKIFLWLFIVVSSLDLVCRLVMLSLKTYPRSVVWTRGMDAVWVLFLFGYLIWAWSLLHGSGA